MNFLCCSDVSELEIVAWDGRGQGEGQVGSGGRFPWPGRQAAGSATSPELG